MLKTVVIRSALQIGNKGLMADRLSWIPPFKSSGWRAVAASLFACTLISGCARPPVDPTLGLAKQIRLTPLRDQGTATPSEGIQLAGAGNEWVSFTIQLSNLPAGVDFNKLALTVKPLTNAAGVALDATSVQAYQLIDMPVDSG